MMLILEHGQEPGLLTLLFQDGLIGVIFRAYLIGARQKKLKEAFSILIQIGFKGLHLLPSLLTP